MDLDSTSKFEFKFGPVLISLIVMFIISFFGLIFYAFYRNWKQILLKKGVSYLFLNENIAINNTFFEIFNKKFKAIFLFLVIYSLSFLLTFLLVLVVLLMTKNSFESTRDMFVFIILGIFQLTWNLYFLLKILSVWKEFKMWKAKNKDLQNACLFENLIVERNDNILRIFLQNSLKKTTTIGMFNTKLGYKLKYWRKSILKSKGNIDNEFYYFLIFNYRSVSINGSYFRIRDYAYIYQNRKELFNSSQNSKQLK
ncbi:MAG0920 family protein [Mycoplasma phocoeninasale]